MSWEIKEIRVGGLETFLITPGSASKDFFPWFIFIMGKEFLCWGSEGTNPTAVAASLQLGPFATAEGLTLNLSICGSWAVSAVYT